MTGGRVLSLTCMVFSLSGALAILVLALPFYLSGTLFPYLSEILLEVGKTIVDVVFLSGYAVVYVIGYALAYLSYVTPVLVFIFGYTTVLTDEEVAVRDFVIAILPMALFGAALSLPHAFARLAVETEVTEVIGFEAVAGLLSDTMIFGAACCIAGMLSAQAFRCYRDWRG